MTRKAVRQRQSPARGRGLLCPPDGAAGQHGRCQPSHSRGPGCARVARLDRRYSPKRIPHPCSWRQTRSRERRSHSAASRTRCPPAGHRGGGVCRCYAVPAVTPRHTSTRSRLACARIFSAVESCQTDRASFAARIHRPSVFLSSWLWLPDAAISVSSPMKQRILIVVYVMVLELTADGIAYADRLHTIAEQIPDHAYTPGMRQLNQRHEKWRCGPQRREPGRPDTRPRIDTTDRRDLHPGGIPSEATVTDVLRTPDPGLARPTTLNHQPFMSERIEMGLIEAGVHRQRYRQRIW